MPKRKPPAPISNFALALTFAAFSVLGYLGISYITQPNTPIIAETNPYDNAQKNLDYQSTQDKELKDLTVKQQKDFKQTNQNLSDSKKKQDDAAAKLIIEESKKTGASSAVKSAAARIQIKQEEEKKVVEESKSSSGVTCPGGNGTVIPAGMWVATGYEYGDGERQCIKCVQRGEVGRYDNEKGNDQACSTAYANNPSHTILPKNAGEAYTGGATTLSNCYRGARIYPNGTLNNEEWCSDGGWTNDKEEYKKDMEDFCKKEDLAFDLGTNKCQLSSNPPSDSPPVVEEGSSDGSDNDVKAERQRQQDNCETIKNANNIAGANKWITCIDTSYSTYRKYQICYGKFDVKGNCDRDGTQGNNYIPDKNSSFISDSNKETKGTITFENDGCVKVYDSAKRRFVCPDTQPEEESNFIQDSNQDSNQDITEKPDFIRDSNQEVKDVIDTTEGSVVNGDACHIPADCQSGWCDPDKFNFGNYTCQEVPNSKVAKQIGELGKYAVGAQCQESNQCELGLFCSKSLFLPNLCKSFKSVYPDKGDVCNPFSLKETKQCSKCPEGYAYTWDGYLKSVCKGGSPSSSNNKQEGESCLINLECGDQLVCVGNIFDNRSCQSINQKDNTETESRSDIEYVDQQKNNAYISSMTAKSADGCPPESGGTRNWNNDDHPLCTDADNKYVINPENMRRLLDAPCDDYKQCDSLSCQGGKCVGGYTY